MTVKERKQLDNNLTSYVEPLKQFDNGTAWLGLDRMRNLFVIDNTVANLGMKVAYQVKNETEMLTWLLGRDLQLSKETTKEIVDYLGEYKP